MRASRLLSIVLLLHTRGRVSAQQLAAELEVSLRTIYRDVEALAAAGVPVYATRGRAGGFALLEGYRTRLTGLTPDEAGALFLAGLPGAAADLGLGTVAAATELKLLAALPPQLRARAQRIRERFHLDAPGWERSAETPPALPAVAEAVWQERRVQVRYRRADRSVVERLLEPLGLVLKAGVWYLVAQPAGGTGPRTYRLSRVEAAAPLPEAFARPAGFDLARHWTAYQADYERRLFGGTARVRLSPRGRQLLFLIGPLAARAGHAAMGAPDGAGWAETTVPIESAEHAEHALLQLGVEVEVLAPPELRERLASTARRLVERYGPSGGGGAGRSSGPDGVVADGRT